MLSGEVSWTVARMIVGVVTPENEAACLKTVRGRTVRAEHGAPAVASAFRERPITLLQAEVLLRGEKPEALEVPGCTARRNLQSHHIQFRSAGGGSRRGT